MGFWEWLFDLNRGFLAWAFDIERKTPTYECASCKKSFKNYLLENGLCPSCTADYMIRRGLTKDDYWW